MRSLVLGQAKEAVQDGVSPFKGAGNVNKEVCWVGPYKYGPCVFALLGPLQLLFIVLALASMALLVIEYRREGFDGIRTVSGVLFILVCVYLVYLGKAIYVLKAFRKEIVQFKQLNKQLRGEVGKLETANGEYESKNQEHERLNEELSDRVTGLGHVEEKLNSLSTDCNGSVQEARQLLQRLDRFVRLDTVNSVFQFFERCDRDRNGKVDGHEVGLFVNSLGHLWQHLPGFDTERIKAEIQEQGGLSLEQVHRLVDVMLREEAGNDELSMSKKLELIFQKNPDQDKEKVDTGSCPGAVTVDPGAVTVDP